MFKFLKQEESCKKKLKKKEKIKKKKKSCYNLTYKHKYICIFSTNLDFVICIQKYNYYALLDISIVPQKSLYYYKIIL